MKKEAIEYETKWLGIRRKRAEKSQGFLFSLADHVTAARRYHHRTCSWCLQSRRGARSLIKVHAASSYSRY